MAKPNRCRDYHLSCSIVRHLRRWLFLHPKAIQAVFVRILQFPQVEANNTLAAVQFPPLNIWDRDIALMTERKWVNKYVRPQHKANAHQPIPYELGRAWTKKAGLDRIEYHSDTSPRTVYDLFGPHNEYGLISSRGLLEIWLNFQIEETDPKRGRQPRTPTSAQHTKVAAS